MIHYELESELNGELIIPTASDDVEAGSFSLIMSSSVISSLLSFQPLVRERLAADELLERLEPPLFAAVIKASGMNRVCVEREG